MKPSSSDSRWPTQRLLTRGGIFFPSVPKYAGVWNVTGGLRRLRRSFLSTIAVALLPFVDEDLVGDVGRLDEGLRLPGEPSGVGARLGAGGIICGVLSMPSTTENRATALLTVSRFSLSLEPVAKTLPCDRPLVKMPSAMTLASCCSVPSLAPPLAWFPVSFFFDGDEGIVSPSANDLSFSLADLRGIEGSKSARALRFRDGTLIGGWIRSAEFDPTIVGPAGTACSVNRLEAG